MVGNISNSEYWSNRDITSNSYSFTASSHNHRHPTRTHLLFAIPHLLLSCYSTCVSLNPLFCSFLSFTRPFNTAGELPRRSAILQTFSKEWRTQRALGLPQFHSHPIICRCSLLTLETRATSPTRWRTPLRKLDVMTLRRLERALLVSADISSPIDDRMSEFELTKVLISRRCESERRRGISYRKRGRHPGRDCYRC